MNALYAGSETEKNLMTAFAMESEARNKYTFFASVAKKEGLEQIADLFLRTAGNEKEHAEIWYKEIYGIGTTLENLCFAAESENHEWAEIYNGFAQTADREGYHSIADKLRKIAMIEMQHEEMYKTLFNNLKRCEVFSRSDTQIWVCRNCGHTIVSTNAPEICPVCDHAQAYFEIKAQNY